jgi:hypothetical protein
MGTNPLYVEEGRGGSSSMGTDHKSAIETIEWERGRKEGMSDRKKEDISSSSREFAKWDGQLLIVLRTSSSVFTNQSSIL